MTISSWTEKCSCRIESGHSGNVCFTDITGTPVTLLPVSLTASTGGVNSASSTDGSDSNSITRSFRKGLPPSVISTSRPPSMFQVHAAQRMRPEAFLLSSHSKALQRPCITERIDDFRRYFELCAIRPSLIPSSVQVRRSSNIGLVQIIALVSCAVTLGSSPKLVEGATVYLVPVFIKLLVSDDDVPRVSQLLQSVDRRLLLNPGGQIGGHFRRNRRPHGDGSCPRRSRGNCDDRIRRWRSCGNYDTSLLCKVDVLAKQRQNPCHRSKKRAQQNFASKHQLLRESHWILSHHASNTIRHDSLTTTAFASNR